MNLICCHCCQAPEATIRIPDLPAGSKALENVCGCLWRANAWPGEAWCEYEPDCEDIIQQLCAVGVLLQRVGPPRAVQLSCGGAQALQVTCTLGQPKKLVGLAVEERLQKSVTDREVADQLSIYELLRVLKQRDWNCVVLPPRARANRMGVHSYQCNAEGEAGRKVWWLRAGDTHVKQCYLLALYLADLRVITTPIPHFAKAEVYDMILTGKTRLQKSDGFVFTAMKQLSLSHSHPEKHLRPQHPTGKARAAAKPRLLPPVAGNELAVVIAPVQAEAVVQEQVAEAEGNSGTDSSMTADELAALGEAHADRLQERLGSACPGRCHHQLLLLLALQAPPQTAQALLVNLVLGRAMRFLQASSRTMRLTSQGVLELDSMLCLPI